MGLGSLALGCAARPGIARRAARRRRSAGRRSPAHFAPRAKNVIFLHMVGAPSQLDLFDYKPTLQKYDGAAVPASTCSKASDSRSSAAIRRCWARSSSSPSTARAGLEISETAAAPGERGRRHRRRQDAAHRADQPRPGAAHVPHRLRPLRPAERRLVGQLRPGQREPRPAGVRRDDHRQSRRRGQRPVGQRLSAERLSGRRVPQPGRPGAVPVAIRRA